MAREKLDAITIYDPKGAYEAVDEVLGIFKTAIKMYQRKLDQFRDKPNKFFIAEEAAKLCAIALVETDKRIHTYDDAGRREIDSRYLNGGDYARERFGSIINRSDDLAEQAEALRQKGASKAKVNNLLSKVEELVKDVVPTAADVVADGTQKVLQQQNEYEIHDQKVDFLRKIEQGLQENLKSVDEMAVEIGFGKTSSYWVKEIDRVNAEAAKPKKVKKIKIVPKRVE
jgi:hypothetical protein